jgi:hypothetical protein
VDIAGSVALNGLTDNNAGIYMNPGVVRLVAEGEEIVGGIDPQAVFANHAAPMQLPPGARPLGSAPTLPAGSGMPGVGMPGMPAQPMQQPVMPAQPMQQPVMPAQPGFMSPAMPQPGGMPMGAPAGMQPFGVAGAGNPIASLGNTGFPAHPGVLGMPQQ